MAQVLQQAATVTLANDVDDDTVNYVVSLREGIMDAWGGILLAYKNTPQSKPPSVMVYSGQNSLLKQLLPYNHTWKLSSSSFTLYRKIPTALRG